MDLVIQVHQLITNLIKIPMASYLLRGSGQKMVTVLERYWFKVILMQMAN